MLQRSVCYATWGRESSAKGRNACGLAVNTERFPKGTASEKQGLWDRDRGQLTEKSARP